MRILRSANGWLLKGCEAALIALILTMVFLGFGQVVLRKFGPRQEALVRLLTDIPVILRYSVLWVAVLGAAIATHRRKHIKIDILTQLLSGSKRRWLIRIADIGGLCICLFLVKGAYGFFKIADNENPLWSSSLLLGFGLISVQFAIGLLDGFFPMTDVDSESTPEVDRSEPSEMKSSNATADTGPKDAKEKPKPERKQDDDEVEPEGTP